MIYFLLFFAEYLAKRGTAFLGSFYPSRPHRSHFPPLPITLSCITTSARLGLRRLYMTLAGSSSLLLHRHHHPALGHGPLHPHGSPAPRLHIVLLHHGGIAGQSNVRICRARQDEKPMAANLRTKLPDGDMLYVYDINRAAAEEFRDRFSGAASSGVVIGYTVSCLSLCAQGCFFLYSRTSI